MPIASHILFPVDFSERSAAMRPAVIGVARRFGAKVTLMHTVHIPHAWYGGGEAMYPVMFDVPAMVENARREMEDYLGPESQGLQIETAVTEGDPAFRITQFAEEHAVDLIMMPTHGYGTFRGLLMGSVTAKVLHDAMCGLWTSAHTEDLDAGAWREVRSIVCAVGLEPESAGLICYAGRVAKAFGARLRLVHAVPGQEAFPERYFDLEFQESLMQHAREEIAKLQKDAGVAVDLCVKAGKPRQAVREAALEFDADLVMIGRGRLHERLGRIRTQTYAIIHDSPCAVLSV
jgi:nucleotide-binding universal stress UspA family protein